MADPQVVSEWLKKADEEKKEPLPTDLHRDFIQSSRQQQIEQEEHIQRMDNRTKQLRRVSMGQAFLPLSSPSQESSSQSGQASRFPMHRHDKQKPMPRLK